MGSWERRRKLSTILCLIMGCSLLLTGCGPSGAEQSPDIAPKDVQTEEESPDGNAEAVTDQRTNGEILASLLENGSWRHTWFEAGISEEDTEEEILQKLEQWESLELNNGKQLQSLECLRLWPNLQSLVINYDVLLGPPIQDFSPIAGLTRLRELYIKYPAGEELDFSFLAQMDMLRELSLVNCDLKDISFLEEMPNLVKLTLCGNGEAEYAETVGKLLKMQDLTLQGCGIRDISFLSGLTELRCLNLNDNSVTDLTPLSELSGLERLELKENKISDLAPLAGLKKLYVLSLDGNRISDLSALVKLPHLNQVGLSDNRIQDFSVLADKPELLSLSVSGNPGADLEPVLSVPFLHFEGGDTLWELRGAVADWMAERQPDLKEYVFIDYMEADLDGDELPDVAFVINGGRSDDEGFFVLDEDSRYMFILLQQEDGSWKEVPQDIPIRGFIYGGVRGDPYRGMWIGGGHVLVKQGWGSSTGTTETMIYRYRQGSLELVQSIVINDSEQGYDVSVRNEEDGTWVRYAIAMEDVMGNCRYVRAELENGE